MCISSSATMEMEEGSGASTSAHNEQFRWLQLAGGFNCSEEASWLSMVSENTPCPLSRRRITH
jgi:hypothetical protein